VSRYLSDIPESLSDGQRRFITTLTWRLGPLTFEKPPPGGVIVADGDDGFRITAKHPEDDHADIQVFIWDNRITIFLGDAHADFDAWTEGDETADATESVEAAVDWFIDALNGRIEVSATFRGTAILSSRYARQAKDGTQHGASGYLTLARLRFWQRKRRVRRTPSWA
jgi:hypothetical protein